MPLHRRALVHELLRACVGAWEVAAGAHGDAAGARGVEKDEES
jgi:hypothetical protein